ncbi:two component transcriptional regulator, LuxR family [Dyadobacter koreensis]|uniref:Two component transcriptional regulator, LuxR family n=1 Tax=Dyadobacter koreensis TaxID=408657 RepID=A0A1H6U3Z9_9BACT|nr:response regulator transcription factor [Dyadobacter koreensis]SEI84297.1 two component transcriptional regulator, LuxR family [Dyadobacter koreensis]
MAIRILVVDDHSVVRQGIITLLEDEEDILIVGEASDGDEVLESVKTYSPDVVLLDLTMPRMSGLDAIKALVPAYPFVKILVFSMHNNPDYIISAVKNGAAGYLLKDTGREEILKAVRSVAAGELYYPPNASSIIIRNLVLQKQEEEEPEIKLTAGNPSVWNKMTPREQQILQCLTEGMSSKDIAEHFAISSNTVANQRASIMRKANVKNTAELIGMALRDRQRV